MEEGLTVWAVLFGQIGRVAQSIILMVIALFSIRTALLFDPQQAQGLEGALAYLDQLAFGPWLLGGVAAGLILQGLFMFIEARYHRIDPEGFNLVNKVEEMIKEHNP